MLPNIGAAALTRLRRAIEDILVVTFLIMLAAVLIQVVGRFIDGFSFIGTEEIANFAQLWLVLVGSGVAMRYGRHVAVDSLVTQLPIPIARVLNILIALGSIWFLGIVFVGALPLVDMGFIEASPAMQIPMWTMYLSLNVGAIYFGLEVVMWVARRWHDPYGKYEIRED
ncbi:MULTISPECIES: TRAP transporter small permease [unclassified Aurantimonas]|uniref:TRAP transporter small permease n=1 Tax=unclassified Aurantimonas TaxID=2638230 RepID=UPI002E179524|nr:MULTISPECIES: TRAP transporter small permease [unclassified Aurantimonas]MEC5293483.1 TRAP transporter small permease [Aurantimonas sp. C2-3-R2]MEC5414552.1 TRAP transporter small permease [Aurantimonas sp. C2-4-R8]